MKKKSITQLKELARKRRIKAIRKKIFGTTEMPRLAVFRSIKNISGQIINDETGTTLLSISTLSKEIELDKSKKKVEQSFDVGFKLGEKALEQGIKEVCFDRGGFLYHGRVKAFADGARKAGLKI